MKKKKYKMKLPSDNENKSECRSRVTLMHSEPNNNRWRFNHLLSFIA